MMRVSVDPRLIRWARERSGRTAEDLGDRFKRLPAWEAGLAQPTLSQVEAFARAVHVPVGYLFLSEPPDESIPIADFRTRPGRTVTRPSPNLLDTIHACQERQSWFRESAQLAQQTHVAFVGSATVDDAPEAIAAQASETLGFDLGARAACRSWLDALRLFAREAEDSGVLVMVSGVVRSNNHRRLDPKEFRGFALSDPLAPLVFVNGADTKAAQMFTLAHEIAHLWLGSTALSDSEAAPRTELGSGSLRSERNEERWCNAVAAELLVPLEELRSRLREDESLADAIRRLSRTFKVSTLVILRRLLDAKWLDRDGFECAWAEESRRLRKLGQRGSSGGDFYRTTATRVSRRFAKALVVSTLEGQTLFRDAYRMLGVSKAETFDNLATALGVAR